MQFRANNRGKINRVPEATPRSARTAGKIVRVSFQFHFQQAKGKFRASTETALDQAQTVNKASEPETIPTPASIAQLDPEDTAVIAPVARSMTCKAVARPTLLTTQTSVKNIQPVMVGKQNEEFSWQLSVPAAGFSELTTVFTEDPACFHTASTELQDTGSNKTLEVLLFDPTAMQPALHFASLAPDKAPSAMYQRSQETCPYLSLNTDSQSFARAFLKLITSFNKTILKNIDDSAHYQIKPGLLVVFIAVHSMVSRTSVVNLTKTMQSKPEMLQVQGIADAQCFQFDPGQATVVCTGMVSRLFAMLFDFELFT